MSSDGADASAQGAAAPEDDKPYLASLTDAVADAVTSGMVELDRLDVIVVEAETRLQGAWQEISSFGSTSTQDQDGFFVLLDAVVSDLKDRLADSRRAASTFNIAFFGRTGAGKSTLLSTLGRLNGELVSDGRSDFTVDVHPLDWQGCRLYDTPGINGWGRTRPRAELEEAAREAVEVADIVLLCFDTQSQQVSEFVKVAAWVRAYRKPVVAVLNVRNAMWRHSARPTSPVQREGLSRSVKQHADNIASELEAIGLPDVPLVAIHSKRGLFARASTPFDGPAATEFEAERAAYGLDYLERMSNLPVLESLMSACVLEGAADLRLAALREGLQAELRDWATEIDDLAELHLSRGSAIEGVISEWLTTLGYPNPERRRSLLAANAKNGPDYLVLLEAERSKPFTAPATGRLEARARHLLRSHLYPRRTKSLGVAEQLVLDAFDEQRRATEAEFRSRVFDEPAIAASIETVVDLAADFVAENLEIAQLDASIELQQIDRSAIDIRGSAGIGRRRTGDVLKAGGLLSTGTSAVLGVIVLTNAWNPAGWTAAAILGGLGIASALLGYFGKRSRKRAEEIRAETRAQVMADARASVNAFFDECESQQLARIVSDSWESASSQLSVMLAEALHIRIGCRTLRAEAEWLRDQASNQDPVLSPAGVLSRASGRVLANAAWNPPSLQAVLLGEDWIQDIRPEGEVARLSEASRRLLTTAAAAQDRSLSTLLHAMFSSRDPEAVERWLASVARSDALDAAAIDAVRSAESLIRATPRVVLLGDYSSGKSSLIKRLLVEAGADVPSSLQVNARAATSRQTGYGFGHLELIDVPGFQSGKTEHDSLALAAAEASALTIVVLHVNLLIGDTAQLERLLHGDERRVGKANTTVFIIGRIDEIGVDPLVSPREFLARREQKIEELRSILDSRGLHIGRGQVLAVAADPHGLVGETVPTTVEDYSEENRTWDGVAALCVPLLAAGAETRNGMAAASALDLGRSALLAAQQRARAEVQDLEETQAETGRLEQLLQASRAELTLLRGSIEQRIARAIGDHANEVLAEALGAGPNEVEVMSKRLQLWYQDPRLASAMTSLEPEIERELDDWSRRHASEFEREERRFRFIVETTDFEAVKADDNAGLKAGIRVAGEVTKHAGNMVKGAGTRDSVYTIVKSFGGKFKPWGAVKLGAKVAKAGAVLGVLAVGFDITDWVISAKKEERREVARLSAVAYVRETKAKVTEDLVGQTDGPVDPLRAWETDLDQDLAGIRAAADDQEAALLETRRRFEELTTLLDAGDELAAHTTTEESR